jgi:hypothetical protein
MARYNYNSSIGAPILIAGNTGIRAGDYESPKTVGFQAPISIGYILLSGDQQSGTDHMLLSGDQVVVISC